MWGFNVPSSPVRGLFDRPYLLLVMTTLLWGGNAVASRLAVGEISPFVLTAFRWIGVCAIMPVVLWPQLKAHAPALKAGWPFIVFTGLLGFTAFNGLMYVAAHSTSAINIGIIQGAIPVFVLIGSALAYGMRAGPLQILGVCVTILGVMVTATRGDPAVLRTLAVAAGDGWMLLACLLYAAYTVGLRKRPAIPGLVFFTAAAMVACLMSLPLLAVEAALGTLQWPTLKGWAIVAFVTIGPSLVSQIFFMRGVELIGPARAGIFVNLVPIFAAFLAVVILGEPFAAYHALALALVLGGIVIAERSGRG
jgi:drug/metabolite transporter (DMT)-like permease